MSSTASPNYTLQDMETPNTKIAAAKQPLPAIAIVGRPNVGKSALFNRLAGRKISIVHDQPGVTRDRISAKSALGKKPFTVIDTGGIGSDVDLSFTEQVRAEADIAITSAHLILFVVDAQAGLQPVDAQLARQLRRVDKPILLVINKVDTPKHSIKETEFDELGFEQVVGISAEHGRNFNTLVDLIEEFLPDTEAIEKAAAEIPTSIAIVGRPNVGKSSLINAILNDNRTLVSNIAGTTRDAVDVPYMRKERHYTLIDTAGIRPRGKVDNSVEVFSVMRSEKSIRRADLCVLVVDASMGVTAQDKKIAGMIQQAQKPCVIVVNKFDLVETKGDEKKFEKEFIQGILAELFFLPYAPVIPLSAKTRDHMSRLFRVIEHVRDDSRRRIGTGQLNRRLQAMLSANPPPVRNGKRFKVLYATQVEPKRDCAVPVPQIVVFVNDDQILPDSYRKYMEANLREACPFLGLPLLIELRGREKRGALRETKTR